MNYVSIFVAIVLEVPFFFVLKKGVSQYFFLPPSAASQGPPLMGDHAAVRGSPRPAVQGRSRRRSRLPQARCSREIPPPFAVNPGPPFTGDQAAIRGKFCCRPQRSMCRRPRLFWSSWIRLCPRSSRLLSSPQSPLLASALQCLLLASALQCLLLASALQCRYSL